MKKDYKLRYYFDLLPYGPGKAAIIVMGKESLNLGENTVLTATGTYDTTSDVDDREGVNFLDIRDEIPTGLRGSKVMHLFSISLC